MSARSFCKKIIKNALRSPLGAPLDRLYRGQVVCLMYHRICRDGGVASGKDGFSPNQEMFVTESGFESHLKEIASGRHGTAVSLDQALQRIQNPRPGLPSIVVSFDDGYRDNLELALPLLKKHGIPAVIYAATGVIDRDCLLWWDEQEVLLKALIAQGKDLDLNWQGKRYHWSLHGLDIQNRASFELRELFKSLAPEAQIRLMDELRKRASVAEPPEDWPFLSWDQLRSLDREPLITIGAHSIKHWVLSQLSAAELKAELRDSKTRLERELGHEIRHLAYPFGDKGQAGLREFEAARAAGFASAMTTRTGHWYAEHAQSPGLFALPRIALGINDDLESLRWKLTGLEILVKRPLSRWRRFYHA